MFHIYALRSIIGYTLLATITGEEKPSTAQVAQEEEWIYEPRLWQYDESDLEIRKEDIVESCEDLSAVGISREQFLQEYDSNLTNFSSYGQSESDTHKLNFLDSKLHGDDCTQARLDAQDSIICTEVRCDKLKFDWPKYKNQITIIQTTKLGMRFHQVHYAFSTGMSASKRASCKDEKIDIFDLFKPKPTPRPYKTTTTTKRSLPSTQATVTTPTTPTYKPEKDDEKGDNQKTYNDDMVATIKINLERRYQTIYGFGGALSDSTCVNMRGLSSKMSKNIVDDYFGDDGLRYTFVRMSIGSSDFSTSPYTNNDIVYSRDNNTDKDDIDMTNFRLTKDDYEYKIPMARLVYSFARGREVKFLASMWSPPVWMKNNSHVVHGYLKGDVYGPYYHGLAELTVKFLEAYKRQGIDFWGLTVLNEPVTGVQPFIFHNSLGITLEDYVTYIKIHLGPMLKRRGFNSTKLLILDDNKGYAPKWVRAVLDDPDAAKYVDGIAIHWYMNDEYENLDFISRKYPDKFILSTEACSGHLPFQIHANPGNWERGVSYMIDIVKMMHRFSVGWIDWNMALDLSGGPSWAKNNLDSAIIVNLDRNEYYKSPMYYAIGHFSRFLEPGSVRVGQKLTNVRYDHPLDAASFLTPEGYIVIVCYNNNKHPISINIVLGDRLLRNLPLLRESFNTIIFRAE